MEKKEENAKNDLMKKETGCKSRNAFGIQHDEPMSVCIDGRMMERKW